MGVEQSTTFLYPQIMTARSSIDQLENGSTVEPPFPNPRCTNPHLAQVSHHLTPRHVGHMGTLQRGAGREAAADQDAHGTPARTTSAATDH